jgi:hypothetical protein
LGHSSKLKGYKCYDPINKKNLETYFFIENEPYFKRKINKIPFEHNSNTIDQANAGLPQIFCLDNLEMRKIEDNGHEIESITQEE